MLYDKWIKCCVLAAAILFGTIPAAPAATVTWGFKDVRFEDGTPIIGTFRVNLECEECWIQQWDIQTFEAISFRPGVHYPGACGSFTGECVSHGWPIASFAFLSLRRDVPLPRAQLLITFAPGSLAGSGPVPISGYEMMMTPDHRGNFFRTVDPASGHIAPIPVPPSLLLLGTGLIGLGWRKYRRRKQ